ncbi:putative 2',3'-cyclic-nucleotide 3'-phosphodiesterase activity [Lyophyllum shimeji]|uniref:2',3'-cyclic-nucleotide 3'-phosphodiesterase activity n=1 Tax=Lyophyllum shimeji TaxID=47721 RepID=A0A9P3PK34_LYOSH|nr:putative 2',3'-cyclic-nucleotide 3'-phosphodiesterase activity [Lyophyllum shimeji]
MDVLLSIVAGLGLRLFLECLQEPLGGLEPVLLGLWEGAAVHLLSNWSGNSFSPDHYLAFALRVAVDLCFTANLQRTFIVLLWTALGMIASETVHPSRPRRTRRRRTSHSVPAHSRYYEPPITAEHRHTARPNPPAPHASTPSIRPSQPATPPSFFLEGESEADSVTPNPSYLPSAFPEGEPNSSESPPPKPVLLPTPPSTLVSDNRDLRGTRDSDHRLSTIAEQSSGEESFRHDYLDVPGGHTAFTRTLGSYAPSAATTVPPIPVPNSTIRYIQTSVSRASPAAELELEDKAEDMYAPSAAPLPVPNAGSTYLRTVRREGTLSDDEDPLQTPEGATARWELMENEDPLMTPPGMSKELSPLVLERNLFPTFGQVLAPELPIAAPMPEASFVINDASIKTSSSVAAAAASSSSAGAQSQGPAAPSAVEYPSTPVAPDGPTDPDPDLATVNPGSGPEPKSSYPTPLASPSPDHDQQQSHDYDHGNHNDHDDDNEQPKQHEQHDDDEAAAETETETETDATSVISSLPARLMYTRAEALRTQARAAEAERMRLVALMNQAASDARVRDVLTLKEEIRLEEVKANKLHEKAARRFFEARNSSHRPQIVDVHGLRVAEAIRMTERALRDALTYDYPFVRVIVGKGLHSANGIPVLKEALMKTMHGHRIPCKVDPNNSGVLILTLPSS